MTILFYMHSSISKFSRQNPNKIQVKSQNKKLLNKLKKVQFILPAPLISIIFPYQHITQVTQCSAEAKFTSYIQLNKTVPIFLGKPHYLLNFYKKH